jgi:hypothetical protein
MRFDRSLQAGRVLAAFIVGLGLVVIGGCGGGDSTAPTPEVKAMGGIQINRGTPEGTPFQAGVVVSVDGQIVNDAEVLINDAPLTYVSDPAKPEQTGYVGMVTASRGDMLTLTVRAAGQTVTQQATVPGMIELNPPAGGFVYGDAQDIPISWQPSFGSLMTIVTCAGASSATPGMWMVAPGTTSYTVPASATTTPGCRIIVLAISGSGDLPTSMDLRSWAGKSGFWVSCQDYVDVMITG